MKREISELKTCPEHSRRIGWTEKVHPFCFGGVRKGPMKQVKSGLNLKGHAEYVDNDPCNI